MKKILIACLLIMMTSCQSTAQLYSSSFLGPFDTVIEYMSYCDSEDQFNEQFDYVEQRMTYYDQLFDKYNSYDDLNNVMTINSMAGKEAVKVDRPLIELVELSIGWYNEVADKVNIAFGSVLDIWQDYRDKAQENEGVGTVPSQEELRSASLYCDITHIHVDESASTIYIDDAHTSIDVGAIAKGYALEAVKDELVEKGITDFLLNGGGDIVSVGKRQVKRDGELYLDECQDYFCVGVQSPKDGNFADDEDYEAILVAQDNAIVTSGDYQRYFEDSNGIRYHHLIDPETLYPSSYFRSVTVISSDTCFGDFMSSTLFLMDFEQGLELVESLDDVEAIWLLEDGKIRTSSHLKDNEGLYVIDKERLS